MECWQRPLLKAGTFSGMIPHGAVGLNADYQGVGKKLAGVVLGGETTQATIDFGDVLGALRIRVLAGGEDVTREANCGGSHQADLAGTALRFCFLRVYGVTGSFAVIPAEWKRSRSEPVGLPK